MGPETTWRFFKRSIREAFQTTHDDDLYDEWTATKQLLGENMTFFVIRLCTIVAVS